MAGPPNGHIPDPGPDRTLSYVECSSSARSSTEPQTDEEDPQHERRSPSWARLIAKVYQVDPLVCARCGRRMSIIGFVTDQTAVSKVLDNLGLGHSRGGETPRAGG